MFGPVRPFTATKAVKAGTVGRPTLLVGSLMVKRDLKSTQDHKRTK